MLSPVDFASWGSSSTDTLDYAYWLYAYPHPATGADSAPANVMASKVGTPPSATVLHESL